MRRLALCWLLVLLAAIPACSSKAWQKIVGKWENAKRPGETFEFRVDGKLITQGGPIAKVKLTNDLEIVQGGPDQRITNRWFFADERRLKLLLAEGPRFRGREVSMKVSMFGGRLKLKEQGTSGADLGGEDGVLVLKRLK
jgi:hypothetical protein